MKQLLIFICISLQLMVLTGCSTLQPHQIVDASEANRTLHTLRADFTSNPLQTIGLEAILTLEPQIQSELLARIPLKLSESKRFNRLVNYFNQPDGLGLKYVGNKTLSASQTYYQREGNCLSMATLFVAMARTLKLDAHINEVHIPPLWQSPQSNTYQLVLHVNAIVKLKARNTIGEAEKIVEFNSDNFNPYRQQTTISDARLQALFASNLAIEAMIKQQTATAFAYLLSAIELVPDEPIFWTNLGALLKRNGHITEAETLLLHSLNLDRDNDMASSALARLYQQQGQNRLAARYFEQARQLRDKNPYIKIETAKTLYHTGHFQKALKLTYQAIAKQKYEHEFYRLLGLCYLQLKEFEHAKSSFEIAKALATNQHILNTYQAKLDLLANR